MREMREMRERQARGETERQRKRETGDTKTDCVGSELSFLHTHTGCVAGDWRVACVFPHEIREEETAKKRGKDACG